MIELRGHHLLCTSLFQGSGYSEEFVKRMTEVRQYGHFPMESI